MRSPIYSIEPLREYLAEHRIARMSELKVVLGTEVNMTVFRKLSALGYHTSYSHRGQFYTLREIARFDERGLWSFDDVRFSLHGTLRTTAQAFVMESPAGYTAPELRRELIVEVKGVLLDLVRHGNLTREMVGGENVYLSAVLAAARRQLLARKEEQSRSMDALIPTDAPVAAHEVRAAIILFVSLLDEKLRRLWAGLESMRIGHGGDAAIARLLDISAQTVAKGREQLLSRDVELERVRRAGGGRPATKKNA